MESSSKPLTSQQRAQKVIKESKVNYQQLFAKISVTLTNQQKTKIRDVAEQLKIIVFSIFYQGFNMQQTSTAVQKYVEQFNPQSNIIYKQAILKLHVLLIYPVLEKIYSRSYRGARHWQTIKYHEKTNYPEVTEELFEYGLQVISEYHLLCHNLIRSGIVISRLYQYIQNVAENRMDEPPTNPQQIVKGFCETYQETLDLQYEEIKQTVGYMKCYDDIMGQQLINEPKQSQSKPQTNDASEKQNQGTTTVKKQLQQTYKQKIIDKLELYMTARQLKYAKKQQKPRQENEKEQESEQDQLDAYIANVQKSKIKKTKKIERRIKRRR